MSVAQRVVKYCAIAFGIFIVFIIVSAIVGALTGILGLTTFISNDKSEYKTNLEKNFSEYSTISDIYVDVGIAKLNVYDGSSLKVDAKNMSERFECKVVGKTLYIKDNLCGKINFGWFNNIDPVINLYIPQSMSLNETNIKTGVGDVRIDKLTTNKLYLSTGIGKTKIDNLKTTALTKLTCGVGELDIDNANITDLILENGIGETSIKGKILGNSSIKGGIGEIDLRVSGNSNDYDITKKSGIGNIDIGYNSNKASTLAKKYILSVESGIGSIKINFAD
jgi:hypothetical protein